MWLDQRAEVSHLKPGESHNAKLLETVIMEVTILDSDTNTGLTGFLNSFNNQPFLKTLQLRCAVFCRSILPVVVVRPLFFSCHFT